MPILYAPLFPLMRIALKGNPRLPQYYAGALGAAPKLRRLRDVQRVDSMSFVGFAAFEAPSPDKQVVTARASPERTRFRAGCKQCGRTLLPSSKG